MGQMTQPTAL